MSQDKPVLTKEWLVEERKFWAEQVVTKSPLDIGIKLRVATCDLALSAIERQGSGKWAERALCEAIVATQDGSSGRMVCDVERLLHHFNSLRPQAQDAQTGEGK